MQNERLRAHEYITRKKRAKEFRLFSVGLGVALLLLAVLAAGGPSQEELAAATKAMKGEIPLLEAEIVARVETVEPEEEHVPEGLELAETSIPVLDIPLSAELQAYTREVCHEYEVPFEIALGMMYAESSFRADAICGKCYGLMQVSDIHLPWLEAELGTTDLLDPEQNIRAGLFLFSGLLDKFGDIHKSLMAYNHGQYGAKELWEQGITSTKYSRKVVDYAAGLEG